MKILAVGAHPDDIEAQIGGTIAKLGNGGAKTLLVAATATSTGASSSELRDNEARRAAKCIGSNFISLGISPDEFSFSRKYISIFDDLFDAEKPDVVFTVNAMDSHHEHQFVSQCIRSASRKNTFSLISLNQAFPGGVGAHSYNYFSNISDFYKQKMEAVMCYESQIKKYGQQWIESIESRDRSWGFNFGCSHAEVANIDKWIT
jgi:LmbE family N-acetylglucosaminyl deacetylase